VGMLSAKLKGPRAGAGVLGEGEVSSSRQLGDRIWCILGFGNRIKMVNCENDAFCQLTLNDIVRHIN